MNSMCGCLYKWLLCSSDNVMKPNEASGYEGEKFQWSICYATLNNSEGPFSAVTILSFSERHLHINKGC